MYEKKGGQQKKMEVKKLLVVCEAYNSTVDSHVPKPESSLISAPLFPVR